MIRSMMVVLGALAASLAAPIVAADGRAVWEKHCAGCHTAMAPKIGDKAAWAPIVKQGPEQVTAVVIKGKGMMPPKGTAASDADVKAAVEYILSQME